MPDLSVNDNNIGSIGAPEATAAPVAPSIPAEGSMMPEPKIEGIPVDYTEHETENVDVNVEPPSNEGLGATSEPVESDSTPVVAPAPDMTHPEPNVSTGSTPEAAPVASVDHTATAAAAESPHPIKAMLGRLFGRNDASEAVKIDADITDIRG